MEQEFITIGEAARLLNQTDIAIMRLIKDALEAGVAREEIMKQEQRGDRIMVLVKKTFLVQELEKGEEEQEEVQDQSSKSAPPLETQEPVSPFDALLFAKDEMISILQKIADTKDQQIQDLSRKIDDLIERDHETNILLKGLQDRIFYLEQGEKEEKDSRKQKKNT